MERALLVLSRKFQDFTIQSKHANERASPPHKMPPAKPPLWAITGDEMGLIKTTSFDHHKGNKPITTILTPPGWVASESDSLTDLMARDNGVSKIAWLPENFQFSGEDSGGGDKDEGDSYSDSESDSLDSQEPAEKLTSRGFVVGRRNGVVEFYGPDHMLREDVELCDDDDESSSSDNDSNSDSDSDSDSNSNPNSNSNSNSNSNPTDTNKWLGNKWLGSMLHISALSPTQTLALSSHGSVAIISTEQKGKGKGKGKGSTPPLSITSLLPLVGNASNTSTNTRKEPSSAPITAAASSPLTPTTLAICPISSELTLLTLDPSSGYNNINNNNNNNTTSPLSKYWKGKNLPPDPQTLLQRPLYYTCVSFLPESDSLVVVGSAHAQVRLYDVRTKSKRAVMYSQFKTDTKKPGELQYR